MGFKLPNQKTKSFLNSPNNYGSTSVPGTPILRKDLEDGILGEANNDGGIFLSNSIEEGSEQERSVLMHEMKHMTDMKVGKLGYTDTEVTWNGDKFKRQDGHIEYDGQWYPEGDKSFPWEQH